jgi:hypothetical protein
VEARFPEPVATGRIVIRSAIMGALAQPAFVRGVGELPAVVAT